MEDITCITTNLPTYLQLLLQKEENIRLAYKQKWVESPQFNKKTETWILPDEAPESELDLTGTPLKIDLGGNDDLDNTLEIVNEIPFNWSLQEASQFSLTLKEARKFINEEVESNRCKKLLCCLCDGQDSEHTVVLGVQMAKGPNALLRFLVKILPCYSVTHEITTLSYMVKEHLNQSVRKNAEVKISTFKKYNLYGYNLRNCSSLETVENNGHISIDVSVNHRDASTLTMNLQVILGHSKSSLLRFWKDLNIIHSLINKFEPSLNSAISINEQGGLDFEEVKIMLLEMLKTPRVKKIHTEILDLNDLRYYSDLDRLWDILKNCSTVDVLRNALQFYFEELAMTDILVKVEDQTVIGRLINDIVNEKIAVPNLNLSKSLEVLIELGLEKLKNDYLHIIKFFGENPIKKTWDNLRNDVLQNAIQSKRSRISSIFINATMDSKKIHQKVAFLDSLHEATELIFLIKDNFENNTIIDNFCRNFFNLSDIPVPKQRSLCKFSFEIFDKDVGDLLQKKIPEEFVTEMKSTVTSVEIITSFCFTQYPIFPPSVFDDYEVPETLKNENFYYTAKFVQYDG